MKVKT